GDRLFNTVCAVARTGEEAVEFDLVTQRFCEFQIAFEPIAIEKVFRRDDGIEGFMLGNIVDQLTEVHSLDGAENILDGVDQFHVAQATPGPETAMSRAVFTGQSLVLIGSQAAGEISAKRNAIQ